MVVTSMDIYWVFSFNNYDNDYNPLEIITVLVPGGLEPGLCLIKG